MQLLGSRVAGALMLSSARPRPWYPERSDVIGCGPPTAGEQRLMLLPRGEGAVAPPTPIAAETAPACRRSHELTRPFLTIEERRSAIAYFAAMVCGNALRPP